MENLRLKNWLKKIFVWSAITPTLARADDALPFESTMGVLEKAIAGPFLTSAAIVMVVVTCLMLAFGEWGDGFKRLLNIVLWLSVAFAGAQFIHTMFGHTP